MKKAIVFLVLTIALMTPLFADGSYKSAADFKDGGGGSATTVPVLGNPTFMVNPILFGNHGKVNAIDPFFLLWQYFMKLIVPVGGALMVLRFAFELVGAVIYEGEDSTSKVRSVIVRFLVHVGVAVLGFSLMVLVF